MKGGVYRMLTIDWKVINKQVESLSFEEEE